MALTKLRPAAVLAVACVPMLSSCSGATPPTGPVGGGTAYAVFTGHITLTGEVHVDGTFTDTITGRHETCAQYGDGGLLATTLWVTPSPSDAEKIAGHVITLTGGIAPSSDFRGPGTYGAPTAQVDDLLIDDYSFIPSADPATVVTLGSNASGRMTFSGLADTYNDEAESGTETWTCASSTGSVQGPTITAAPALTITRLHLTGSAAISGAYTQSATFTTDARVLPAPGGRPGSAVRCADFARGTSVSPTTRGFVGPEFDTGGGNSLGFEIVINTGYNGPGVYTSATSPGLSGTVQVTIPPASAPQYDTFTLRPGSTTRLTVDADGSGTVVFAQWYSPASDSYLSGTVRWQCGG